MKLQVSSSKNTQLYYVAKSFRTENGKYSSKIIERLGTMEDLIARFGDEDTLEKVKQYIIELTKEEKQRQQEVVVKYSPRLLLSKGDQRSYNGGGTCFCRRYIMTLVFTRYATQ